MEEILVTTVYCCILSKGHGAGNGECQIGWYKGHGACNDEWQIGWYDSMGWREKSHNMMTEGTTTHTTKTLK